ncbi:YgjP-like metallopeptidase domain-containing protein [Janthinobacterium sp. HH01]|uniref:YgjP-like metallopeptidase domain-containing protein n=1 Tax=Janthinobacterium sp. HH01 TaxID=1198452 RepID=UPI00034C231B|nr:YgjP-like metallopeptidase domain-containing protein [Janthinobacterium sp. HH01]
MALTDTFLRFAKASKPSGDKHYDGGGLYIYVKPQGKYWRLDYRYLNKRKTMALGTYPEVTLVKARKRRDDARVLLADGIDPAEARREEREVKLIAASHTFESVALKWLEMQGKMRSASTQDKVRAWLEHDVFPLLGKRPISAIKPRDVLAVAQKVEAREAYDSAHRIKQMCGQIFRYAVALDLVQRDVTADLRGALAVIPRSHHAALTEPKDVAALMRAIQGYDGYPVAKAALKLAPLVFVRPGELRAAEWAEIDLDDAEWRIPAVRMKMHIEHVVPLSRQPLVPYRFRTEGILMRDILDLGELHAEVIRKAIKHVHLSVLPPVGKVRVAAPQSMPLDTIRLFVISKLAWIRSQQRKLQAQDRETPREFLNKESHYLWGKRYLLKISFADAAPAVSLTPRVLQLQVRPGADQTVCEEVLDGWYRQQIRDVVPALLDKWEPLLGVKVIKVFVQRMKTKWGSCTPRLGYIRFNTDLAKKPPECLEYIVVHELVHLLEPTHNEKFSELMDLYLPHWQHFRKELPIASVTALEVFLVSNFSAVVFSQFTFCEVMPTPFCANTSFHPVS